MHDKNARLLSTIITASRKPPICTSRRKRSQLASFCGKTMKNMKLTRGKRKRGNVREKVREDERNQEGEKQKVGGGHTRRQYYGCYLHRGKLNYRDGGGGGWEG
jgi:hypothetical protein